MIGPEKDVLDAIQNVLKENSRDVLKLLLAQPKLQLFEEIFNWKAETNTKGWWPDIFFVQNIGIFSEYE